MRLVVLKNKLKCGLIILPGSRRVIVFGVESLAHINSVLEGFSVTRSLEGCGSRNVSFSANARSKSNEILVEVINGNSEVSKDSVVLTDGSVVDFDCLSFLGNGDSLGLVEVLKKAVEEVFELINDITTDSTFEVRLLEERSNDSTEFRSLVSLNHVSEHLVHVSRKLNKTGTSSLLLEVIKNWVDSLDSSDSGVKLVVDESVVGSFLSSSLGIEVIEDGLDGGNVSLSSCEISLGRGLGVFTLGEGSLGSGISTVGGRDFRVSETNFGDTFSILIGVECVVLALFIRDGSLHATDLLSQLGSCIFIISWDSSGSCHADNEEA